MTTKEYNQCVDQYADALYRYVSRAFNHIDDARDVVQHCFEKLWLKHHGITVEEVKGFLFVSARNAAIDTWRKEKRLVSLEERTDHAGSYEDRRWEYWHAAMELLKVLNEEQRSIFLLREYEGYPYEDIAQIMGMSLSQVKVTLFRSRQKMLATTQKKIKAV